MSSYASYKDSGVAWIGDIPSHWIKSKFKFVSELQTGNSLNDEQKQVYESDNPEEIPYVSSKDIDVDFKTVNYDNGLRIPRVNNKLRVSPKGSFLMVIEGGSAGRKMVYLDKEVCFVNKLCSFHSRENTKFQYYFVQSNNYQDKFRTSLSGLIGGVSISNLREFALPLPPLTEQQQIVTFLDLKTSQIDELIQKKTRKIELLKEYRTALINQIVTNGLFPNVKMKDSGVEWIGEIPGHWDIKKLKYISDVRPSNVDKHIYQEEIQVRLCNYTDVYYNEVINSNTELKTGSCTMIEFQKFKLESGDVIITKDSETPDDIGIPVFIEETLSDVVCGYHLTMLKPLNIDGKFLYRFIQSYRTRKYFELNSNGVTRFGLGKNSIENLIVPSPPAAEQHQIASYLHEQTEKIESSIQLEKKKIKHLKEYRQSLISEVVTGKMKVF
jgi:type I restriction enzyme S subunit